MIAYGYPQAKNIGGTIIRDTTNSGLPREDFSDAVTLLVICANLNSEMRNVDW